ncbi:MAG: hypothetical protein K0M60_02935 [Hydrogenophaga sp.]|nr:hypothetical protein [Hydrogenophaga sp.]
MFRRSGTSFPLFFAARYIGFLFCQATSGYVNDALKANKTLLSYPNVAPIGIFVARFFLQIGTTTFVAFLVLGSIGLTLPCH